MSDEIPSLKERIMKKIPVLLWSRPENMNRLISFRFQAENTDEKIREWDTLVDKIKEQALTLNLPPALNEELMLSIKPIGSEVIKWRSYHENYFFLFDCYPFVDLLSWTPEGVIDYSKTAQNIVRQDNDLTLYERYVLACLFCLEDDIPVIWGRFSDEEKRGCVEDASKNPRHKELLAFFTSAFSMDVIDNDLRIKERIRNGTANRFAFENAATTGNLVATEYFLQRLTQEERAQCLTRVTVEIADKCSFWMITFPVGYPKESYSDILCYLFTQMTEKERVPVFKSDPYNILRSFLEWPRQKVFLDLFKAKGSLLSASDYQILLCVLVRNHSWSAYNYAQLFEEIFLRDPTLHQEFVVLYESLKGYFLYHLLDCNNENAIRLVLHNIEPAIKNQLLFTEPGFHFFRHLILIDKLCLFEKLVEEFMLSKEDKEQIAVGFRKHIFRNGLGELLFKQLAAFFTVLLGKDTPRGGKKIRRSDLTGN